MKEYNVYIDESGDEGINKGSKYFILTAIIVAKEKDLEISKSVDIIKKNLELNPKLWNSKDELIPVVREKLLGIAKFFIEDLGLYTVKDIRITGSEANYNYNEFSDIDLHIVYDFEKF
jgi:hypothetical protein